MSEQLEAMRRERARLSRSELERLAEQYEAIARRMRALAALLTGETVR